ncbi:hypothetical protein OAF27_00855 [Verrucomicrobiales bacterium]|nr:hypothetical protein [Verrucomicrobiales bacterium]
MKNKLPLVIVGCSILLFTSCATKKSRDRNAPEGSPTATLTIQGGQAAYWASTGGGRGTINFQGQDHAFSITGVGAGGTGAQKISATGDVYNLTSLSDFEGIYTVIRSGFTVIKGRVNARLTNKKGVIIYVTAKTTGLASAIGTSKVVIKLKE